MASGRLWMHAATAATSRPMIVGAGAQFHLRLIRLFSPNMRWIAYEAAERGKLAVYMRPFPGPGSAVRLSNGEGAHPRWRADGRAILFLAPGRIVMSVGVTDDRTEAVTLSTAQRVVTLPAGESFEPLGDGQRFFVRSVDGTLPPMSLVIGWPRLTEPRTTKP